MDSDGENRTYVDNCMYVRVYVQYTLAHSGFRIELLSY